MRLEMNMTILIVLLAGMVISAAICVMMRYLLNAAIMLAVTSAILSVVMFMLGAPLAGVFELSVCAGLVTVIFISAISMTKTHTKEERVKMARARRKRFVLLPVVLAAVLVLLCMIIWPNIDTSVQQSIAQTGAGVSDILWNKRQVDIIGQIIIILTGVFGVVIFFKESEDK